MSRAARILVGALLAVAAMAGTVALSRAPYATGQGDVALLRLSWSGRPQRIERCRELSDAELAERPAHMRRRLECEGRSARYAVRVAVDGRTAALDTVTGGGLRGDRAIHMLREFPVAPGARALAVTIERIEAIEEDVEEADDASDAEDVVVVVDEEQGSAPGDRSARERAERRRERQEGLPARLELTRSVTLEARSVAMVTYDPSGRRLLLVTGPRR